MADTLEKLEIEIVHKSQGADSAVNAVTRSVSSLGKSLDKTADATRRFSRAFQTGFVRIFRSETQAISNFAKNTLRRLNEGIKSLTKNVKSSITPLSTLFSSLKRIAFYRLIRSAIKAITQAFQEGAENAYWYSREFGIASKYISEAYDALATSSFQMKNQLGAAWATLIAAIEPVIEQIISLVQRAAEVVTQFFAILGGKSTYLKAVKVARQWADATEDGSKAAKEWRNQLLGFDEINRLDAPTDSGSGSNKDNTPDYGTMFEEAPIKNYMADLFDAIRNGEWARIGEMLADKINGLVDAVDWYNWGNKIGEKINNAIQAIYAFLKKLDFKELGKSVATAFMGMMDAIDFETAGRLFVRKFTAMLDFIIGFIMTPGFWDKLAKSIGDFFHGALSEAAEWLSENNLADVMKTLGNGILNVLQKVAYEVKEHRDVFVQIGKQIGEGLAAIPWTDILKTVADILWTVFKSLVIDGLFSTSGGRVFLALLAAVKGLKLVFTMASPVIEAGIEILASNIAAKLMGIPAAATAAGEATATAVTAIGPTLAAGIGGWKAAVATQLSEFTVMGTTLLEGAAGAFAIGGLAVSDAILLAYDWKTLKKAAQTYNETGTAINKNVEANKNGFIKILNSQGREAADQYAEMVLGVQTYGMDYSAALTLIDNKTREQYAGMPKNWKEGFKQGWDYYFGAGSQGGLVVLVEDAFKQMIDGVKSFLGMNGSGGSTKFAEIGKSIVEGLKTGWNTAYNSFVSGVKSALSQLASDIGNSLRSAFDTANQKLQSFVSTAKQKIDSVASSINTVVEKASSKLSAIVGKVQSAMATASSAISGTYSSIQSGVATAVNNVKTAVSNVVSNVTKYFFADGGYPEQGQLFVAREAGPELVGSIGGRTAVASNDDILDGIRQGVYDAVSAAMGGSYGSQDIRVYLDGREVRASQRRLDRVLG